MRFLESHKARLALICAVCTGSILAAYIWAALGHGFTPLVSWEMRFRNFLVREGTTAPVDRDLMFIAIDNDSVSIEALDLDQLFIDVPRDSNDFRALQMMSRQWPWPRELYALMLDKLVAAGARVVAFDLLFPKPTPGDDAFRAALDRHRDRVVIGSNFVPQMLPDGRAAEVLAVPTDSLVPNTEPLDPRVAYVNFWPDEADGCIRRARFRTTAEGLSGFPVRANSEVFDSFAARIVTAAGLGERVPAGHDRQHLFRYAAPPGAGFPPVSAHQIFVPRYWQANFANGARLRGKIVVIGPFGNWQHDEHETPYGTMAGPEVHLNAITALLHGELLKELPLWLECLVIAANGLIAWAVSLWTPRLLFQMIRGLLLTLTGVLVAMIAYNFADLYLPAVTPLLAMNASGGACFAYQFILERLEKSRMRRTLERYVGRDVVHEIIDNRASLFNSLEGTRKPITVLFSDLRGFTAIAESADAVSLVRQLNEYFDSMVRIVFEASGTLDKFIGDGVMAHWGSIATGGQESDAYYAVRTALRMRLALKRLNDQWRERGWKELGFGIGINSGDAIVGNLGCEERMEVSVIGDAVNLAARIEGATKEYRVDLLIGEEVARLIRKSFVLRTVDMLQVKGRTLPVEVFTVLEERTGSTREPEWLRRYEEAVRLYRRREFDEAHRCFEQAAELHPGDWLTEEYLRRTQLYAAEPPEPEWTGVHVMTRK